MARAFSISLNTKRVLPQPVGPATSAVNGCRRGSVIFPPPKKASTTSVVVVVDATPERRL